MARKVLLADDSAAIQKAVEAALEQEEIQVFSVSNGEEAIKEAKNIHPDVILLDADLPPGDGYQTCRRLKEDPELQGIPVILLTSEEASGTMEAQEAGADGLLAKPFQERDLIDKVFGLMDLSVESTVKIDTADMEVLDFGEEAESLDEELGDLELDDEDILELTDEVESDRAEGEAGEGFFDLEQEFSLEEEHPEVAAGESPGEPSSGIKTEEIEEISFEEELEDLDLAELDMEGAEEALSSEQVLAETAEETSGLQDLSGTDELEWEELEEKGPSPEGPSAMEEELLSTGEEPPAEPDESVSQPLVDTDELEDLAALEELEGAETSVEEPFAQPTTETTVDVGEELEEISLDLETQEEFPELQLSSTDEEFSVSEEIPELEETTLDLGEGPEAEVTQTEIEESLHEMELEAEEEFAEPSTPQETPPEAAEPMHEEETVSISAAGGEESLEEVPLEEELAAAAGIEEPQISQDEVELEEIALDSIPSFGEAFRPQLTEEDFGFFDPYSQDAIRRGLSENLHQMVERLLADLAPPIIEQVARDIALERAEKIISEEIARLKAQPSEGG